MPFPVLQEHNTPSTLSRNIRVRKVEGGSKVYGKPVPNKLKSAKHCANDTTKKKVCKSPKGLEQNLGIKFSTVYFEVVTVLSQTWRVVCSPASKAVALAQCSLKLAYNLLLRDRHVHPVGMLPVTVKNECSWTSAADILRCEVTLREANVRRYPPHFLCTEMTPLDPKLAATEDWYIQEAFPLLSI